MASPLGDADSFSWLSIKMRAVRQAPRHHDVDGRGILDGSLGNTTVAHKHQYKLFNDK